MREQLRRLVLYAGANCIALPINFGTAFVLYWMGVDYLVATLAGYVPHVMFTVKINQRFAFRSHAEIAGKADILISFVGHCLMFFVALGLTTYGVESWALDFEYARAIAAIIAGCGDFAWDAIFVFLKPYRRFFK